MQAEDFDITAPSNVADEGDEEEMKRGDTNSPIANDVPSAKKIKLEEE